ncbi:hypothetical protein LSH36_241g07069 [Paralvinella palmiformis]|uniref:Uncharacterized protein n=1 Tax=Paralvinella palmiformis TaxID=53620 RepID=A0AAD9N3J4_9ANNE|nr:hypothetical protein LSH36_241g07069 [Paralvinella palmiformis]
MLSDGKLRKRCLRLEILMAASTVGPTLGQMLIPVDGIIGKTLANVIGRGIGKFIGGRRADFLGFK